MMAPYTKYEAELHPCSALCMRKEKPFAMCLNQSLTQIGDRKIEEHLDRRTQRWEKTKDGDVKSSSVKLLKYIKADCGKTKVNRMKDKVSCALCKRLIENKYLLHALGKFWHEKCLKCDFCRKPLYKLADKFYHRQGAKFCHEDFLRTFGDRGICSMCDQVIPSTDYVLRFKNGKLNYHLECFKCIYCRTQFCVGDPVTISGGKNIICSKCRFIPEEVLNEACTKHYREKQGRAYQGNGVPSSWSKNVSLENTAWSHRLHNEQH